MTTGDDPKTVEKAMKAAIGCPPEKQLGSGYEKRISALERMIGQLRGALYEWQGNADLLRAGTRALLEMTSFDSELLPQYCDERDELRAELADYKQRHADDCAAMGKAADKLRAKLKKGNQLLKEARADAECYTATATRLMKELIDAGVGSHHGSFSSRPNTLAGMVRAAIQRIQELEGRMCGTCHGLGEVHIQSRWDPADVRVYECLECGEPEAKKLRAEVQHWRAEEFAREAKAVLDIIAEEKP